MDLDVMHRQMRDLIAFKEKAEPIIAKMEEFLSDSGTTEAAPEPVEQGGEPAAHVDDAAATSVEGAISSEPATEPASGEVVTEQSEDEHSAS